MNSSRFRSRTDGVVPRLILSVDQVAAIRASRQSIEPDPVHFALDAEMAGFEGIKAHLRLDRRHIIENDVELLNKMVKSDFFLQISTNQDVLHLVNSLRPRNLILVSERRDEVHTDTGLDVSLLGKQLYHTIREIDDRETKVFLAVDPDLEQIRASAKLEVHGLCISLRDQILQDTQFTRSSSGFFRTAEAVKLSVKYGLETHLFNSISWNVLPRLTSIPGVSAIHLGHHFISDCLFRGLHETARAYRQRLNEFHEEK